MFFPMSRLRFHPRAFMVVFLGGVAASATPAGATDCVNLFNRNQVLTLNITMPEADWEAMRTSCPDGQCGPSPHFYWGAMLNVPECPGIGSMFVGIRRKNGPAEPAGDPQKVSLKIDVNEFVANQTLFGKKKLSLESGAGDVLVTEAFSYVLFEATGIPSGRAAWVNVYINGDYKGIYGNVEQLDKAFLVDHGINDGGFLYKNNTGEGAREEQRTRELETNPFRFSWYPFDHPAEIPVSPQPSDWRDQARWRVNIPHLLTGAAVESFIANTDGMVGQMHNYWYYDWSTLPNDDPAGQQPRLYFPWDLDTVMKSGAGSTGQALPCQGGGQFCAGLLTESEFQSEYYAIYRQLLEGPLALSQTLALLNAIEPVISPHIDADPYQTTTDSAASEFQRVRDYLQARTTFLLSQLGGCPDGTCDPGEDSCTCPADCGNPPTTETNCADGADNDCDTLVDCLDADCVCGCQPPDCNDANPCTNDACVNNTCQHANNTEPCDDGLFCNAADSCSEGTCSQHAGDPCPGPDGDANCAESCNDTSNNCTATDPNGSACNDGLFCTFPDACSSASCVGGTDTPCIDPANCDEGANTCTGETPPPVDIVWNSDPISPDRTTRSLRFTVDPPVTATATPGQSAIKVTMIDLQNPVPPNLPANPPPNFSGFESATCAPLTCIGGPRNGLNCTVPADCPDGGTCMAAVEDNGCARWVGKPGIFLESQDAGPSAGTYRAARLQCTPLYLDWITETASGPIAVVGAEIAPSSEYSVQTYGASCKGAEAGCVNVSAPVQMFTRRSGDVEVPFNPPATSDQPDVTDIAQLVNKFKNVAGAPVKAVAQLQPNLPDINVDINALDIVAVVDGVKEKAYAFSGPCPCPSTVTCGSTDCTSPTPCVTAFGAGATCVKTCNGGSNAGDPCINDTHCPDSTCGSGFCRDRCGRCTP